MEKEEKTETALRFFRNQIPRILEIKFFMKKVCEAKWRRDVSLVFYGLTLIITAKIADKAKRIPQTMLRKKRNFSNPRRVWWKFSSPPPKAPPTFVPDCWSNMEVIKTTDRIICP